MTEIEKRFILQLNDPRHGDIAPFLWTLRRYAACSRTIVELGVDDCSSTVAFLLGKPEYLYSYDLWRQKEVDDAERWAKELGVNFEFQVADSREVVIPYCDLLFIDTDHTAKSTLIELHRHAPKANQYILLHDVVACGDRTHNPEDYDGEWIEPGLWTGSIGPFLRSQDGQDWQLAWIMPEHVGMACLMRVR